MTELLKIFIQNEGLWFILTVILLWYSREHLNTLIKNISEGRIIFRVGAAGVSVEPQKLSNKGPKSFAIKSAEEILPEMPLNNSIECDNRFYLVHTAIVLPLQGSSTQWYDVKIKVEADTSELYELVDYVEYQLHESFDNRYIKKTTRNNGFLLQLNVWGEFNIRAILHLKDGKAIKCLRYLDLPGRPPY